MGWVTRHPNKHNEALPALSEIRRWRVADPIDSNLFGVNRPALGSADGP